ncbi:uncharacterized WD repeat-containing protein C17D11.16 isoform X1 [Vicia villosa]|uniref:uncharacterized WD repeat-containing protein C17D11.16 isoform X1 n=1 Tax=Vicia villosa TaxID=3911 RepID=UPI00273ADED0|nr:uncharacterized WD repeat-containing protein C17D11.16 isoform X1 [Vicia villosa]
MIAAISWIPKGVFKAEPVFAELPSKEEIEKIISNTHDVDEENDMEEDTDKNNDEVAHALTVADAIAKPSKENTDEITLALQELNMETYDEEDDKGFELFSSDLYYQSNEMDPYIKDKKEEYDSEDLEDMVINPTDSVVVCARTEDDVNFLEVWILEDANTRDMNLYIHHDIIIPEFPLCTAWLDCPLKGGEKGNFLAVGSMGPSIEIWDLDVIDEVEPCVALGGIESSKTGKNGKKKSIKYREDSHTSSVLGLAWNKEFRNLLASASADKSVKIWDVVAGKCTLTMEHHTDKVQAVAWNHHRQHVLLSGSFDHTVTLKDVRNPSHSGCTWSVGADVESLAWDPHAENLFAVSLEDGTIKCYDVRNAMSNATSEQSATFTLHAHDKSVTSLAYNMSAPNLLATGSTDKTVKLWDLSNNQPSCVATKEPKAGSVFSISFAEDNPFLLAIGGSKGKIELWDTLAHEGVSRRYEKYSRNQPQSGA